MISEVLTSQGKPAITSDQWHLIESRFTRDSRKRPFARRIVSEHANRAVCREAARLMREQGPGGVIINMSWDHVSLGMAGENPVLYSAAKGAVMSFSKSFAREVAPDIRVNILAPGFIETAFGKETNPRFRDEVVQLTPMRRWGTPEDVAAAAVFLASDDARFMTGQMIMVNGGVV
jgi:3-oxoacyl-[acyl-carrier protein] reductase